MWPISTRFAEALTRDHFVVTKAEILDTEDVLLELSTQGVLVEGSVTASRAEIQRTATVTLVDRDGTLTPRRIDDLLVPSGRQIRLYRGIMFNERLSSGLPDVEYVPIGTFRFTVSESTYPAISLSECYDRSWIVSGAKLADVVAIADGSNVVDVIGGLIQGAYPGVPMNLPSSVETTNGMTWDAESDPWNLAQTLAANLGSRLYFDPMGVLQMTREPSDGDPIVWDYDDSYSDSIVMPDVSRTWTGNGYNAVVVIAENSNLDTGPLRVVAYDTDPGSPTQWGGNYGRRPAPIIRDETISTLAQAQMRATKELQSNLGLLQAIAIPTIVNPAYEVGDTVRVAVARSGETGDPPIPEQFCVVDGFDVPLRAAGGQTLTTRARQVVR